MEKVLVTGGSGFVGSYVILHLLKAGYEVRATVRDPAREETMRALLRRGGADPEDRLSVVLADLTSDEGWDRAAAGCAYVQHVASPMPPAAPKHQDELVVPAREGTLRVLRAAAGTGVKRVVLTSSFAAVSYGHGDREGAFTEQDWSILTADLPAYQRSKTVAERAAWDFVAREGRPELVAINPVGVFGPVLGADFSASVIIIERLLSGRMPGAPKLSYGYVDVRDLADLHLRAMTAPQAAGQRFIAAAPGTPSMLEIATILRQRLGAAAAGAPKRELPNWLVRLAALGDPALRLVVPTLGKIRRPSADKAMTLLGWTPRPVAQTIEDTGRSLIDLGLVPVR